MSLSLPFSLYNLSCSIIYLSLNQCHLISHVFERLGFIPELTDPYVVEFSVLSGVTGCLLSKVIRAVRIPIVIFPLLNVPHVSASAADNTILRFFLHSVWIGPFRLGDGLTGSVEVQSLR